MAKEKKRIIDSKETQTTMFYYEIIGSFAIIFSITVLGKLGTIGNIFTIFFKVAFGDWFWLIVLFVLFFGVYCLFMHKKFNFVSHRFIGFIFIITAILTFSHFPVHSFIANKSGSYFQESWLLYKSYLNTGISSSLGGGMIGAIIFYAMFYLLGKLGVILLGLILIALGSSLLFNKSLKEMSNVILKGLVGFRKKFKGFNNFFKYEVGKDLDKNHDIKNIKIPLKILNKSPYNNSILLIQEEDKLNYAKIIKEILYNYNVNYKPGKIVVSYYVVTLFFEIYSSIEPIVIFKEIKKKIQEETFFSVDCNVYTIQIALKEKRSYSLRDTLELQTNININNYIFGVDYLNNAINVDFNKDTNFLLIGTFFVGIKNFIISIIIQSLIKKSYNFYEFYLFDNLSSLTDIDYLFTEIDDDIFSFLDLIKNTIEKRLDDLKQIGVNSYSEYLKNLINYPNNKRIPKTFIFINEVSSLNDKYETFESKLLYIKQLSLRAGFTIFYIVRKPQNLNNIIYSVFETKIIFKAEKELISNLLSYEKNNPVLNNSLYLEGYGDAFYVYKNDYTRFLPPKITKLDLDSMNKHLRK